ncbi:hypothetical protein SAMN00790413_01795 [Deinococcus hopiensis KR-140]|uniref:Uncharacterized protein n=1 Tax=Deinococcus hopiensis KR-140 TaxID=695939 RepID=A0A1W1VI90_9DEIO|nr:hypothetical protein SAMN00790413_01795 [Deinococcus hopiensis KR-140]
MGSRYAVGKPEDCRFVHETDGTRIASLSPLLGPDTAAKQGMDRPSCGVGGQP